MGLEVKYPYLLVLTIPAGLLIFLFCHWAARSGRMNLEKGIMAGLRASVFLLLICALTVPQILLPVKGEAVIFLVDQSASVKGTEEKVLNWIEESIDGKGKADPYAIVAFGKNAVTEQALGKTNKHVIEFNGKTDGGETDLESALQFASSLIPSHSSGRIVLFTDGNETIGSGAEAAQILKNQRIELDTVQMEIPPIHEDMAVSDLSVPPALYQGEKAPIAVTIDSSTEKDAVVRISVNDKEILAEEVAVKEGTNVYNFYHEAEETGLQVYKGELVAENDRFIENNALQSVSTVKGTPRILVVQGNEAGEIAPLVQESGLLVDTLPPEKLPTTMAGFLAYQSIIFNNVPATVIGENQMNLIEKAVKEFGTGFVMAGGEESFGLGGYFKTPIEKLLPVDMDIKGKKELPSLGLVIVMDRSGSMGGSKISLAKEAAARSVELLRNKDTLGFIAFDDRPWEIVKTAPLKDKEKVMEKIRSVMPGGGTEIYTSLEMAYKELEDLELQRKHIILLTDGQSNNPGYDELLEEGKEKNITLSSVAIGTDADRGLLEYLAEEGGGRFYDVTDSSVIPSILARETVMATRTYIEDQPFYPSIQPFPEWSPLFKDGVPKMNAYIASTAKPRANVPILSEKKDPVLAEWQYGMGYTVAFTSDFSGKWSGDWAAWPKWPQFINQITTKTLPKYDSEPYEISVNRSGGNTVVHLESAAKSSLPVEVSLVSEKGEAVDANTKLTAPGKYEVVMPSETGMYFIRIKQTDKNGNTHMYQTGFTVPYADEYLLKGTNKELLKELTEIGGGKVLTNEKDAFRPLKTEAHTKQSISEWLLLAAFLLFFTEIALRRFGMKRLGLVFANHKRQHSLPATKNENKIERLKAAKSSPHQPVKNKEDQAAETGTDNAPAPTKRQRPKPAKDARPLTAAEREERMQRLLDAKSRKNK
ncbi:VWA domain-containing protein [Bacillus sp. T33-2]|uniref:VWA domain-containing protein n=1 Tax=Bacillus sp. T33-2 TaxID=2054168 RepID=UPI000C78CA86|nr:VWA domain-containing protein [Bacillus sp. T33-2]PLR97304.1 hypothetical protein CVD19_07390 [Bacillus sp. T33-2]